MKTLKQQLKEMMEENPKINPEMALTEYEILIVIREWLMQKKQEKLKKLPSIRIQHKLWMIDELLEELEK